RPASRGWRMRFKARTSLADEPRQERNGASAEPSGFGRSVLAALTGHGGNLNGSSRFGSFTACNRKDPPPIRWRNPPIGFSDVQARALRRPHRLIAQLGIANSRLANRAKQPARPLPTTQLSEK